MTENAVFPDNLLALLGEHPDRIVFEHGDRTISAAETLATIRRIVAGLRAAGIGPGSGVAVLVGVSPEAFAAGVAANVLGARVAAVPAGVNAAQLEHILDDDIAAVLLDPSTATAEVLATVKRVSVFSVGPVASAQDLLKTVDDGGVLKSAGGPDDVGRITYTSGSTGNPKGCAQTYRGLGENWTARPDRWSPALRQLGAGLERHLLFGSLSSKVAMDFALLALFNGGTLVIPGADAPQPFFPTGIARYGITSSIMSVPRLYQMLDVLRTDPVDVSSLRSLMVSGSPMDPRRFAEALERFGPVVYQGYGQSETGLLSMLSPDEALSVPDALASVGRLLPATELQVRGPDGTVVPPGANGELFVRTPYQTIGYRTDPQEQAEVFAGGWVRTRDLGHLDDEGYLHLGGRSREVIIVNANVHYAGPIERALAAHPKVDQAYVVGALDEKTGETVHAYIVPRKDSEFPDQGELRELVRARFGADAAPKTISFITQVPVTPAGKPDKRALKPLPNPLP